MAYLNAALTRLRLEADLEHPGRSHASDGWIGDKAHQETDSQHNPDPDGSVDAVDITTAGLDKPRWRARILGDHRTRLHISDGVIWSKRGGNGLRPYKYLGKNRHDKHNHTEVENQHERDGSPWGYYRGGAAASRPAPAGTGRMSKLPVLRRNPRQWRAATVQLQRGLVRVGVAVGPAGADGKFGGGTHRGVYTFQAGHGLKRDGVVGGQTWTALGQALLAHHGFDPGPIDGDFGRRTATATEAFQRARGLTVDRVFGPATWAAALR